MELGRCDGNRELPIGGSAIARGSSGHLGDSHDDGEWRGPSNMAAVSLYETWSLAASTVLIFSLSPAIIADDHQLVCDVAD